jgi:hypothetical protein
MATSAATTSTLPRMSASDREQAKNQPDGWRHLLAYDWRTPLGSTTAAVASILALPIANGLTYAVRDTLHWNIWQEIGGVLALPVIFAIVLIFVLPRLNYRRPEISADLRRLRVGRKTVACADLITAKVIAGRGHKRTTLAIALKAQHGPRVIVTVRDSRAGVLDDETRKLVLSVLDQSAVGIPTSSTDPTGAFSRYNYPGYFRGRKPSNM